MAVMAIPVVPSCFDQTEDRERVSLTSMTFSCLYAQLKFYITDVIPVRKRLLGMAPVPHASQIPTPESRHTLSRRYVLSFDRSTLLLTAWSDCGRRREHQIL